MNHGLREWARLAIGTIAATRPQMATEQNKAIYRRFFDEVFKHGRIEKLDEFLRRVTFSAMRRRVRRRGRRAWQTR